MLSTFLRDGRTCAIVRLDELIVEVVVEPEFDTTGEVIGYHHWIRANGEPQPSEQAALFAAMQEVARLSRVRRVAVILPPTEEIRNAC